MDIAKAVRDAGVVGAGGAGFPTHVKLRIPADKDVDVLIKECCDAEDDDGFVPYERESFQEHNKHHRLK